MYVLQSLIPQENTKITGIIITNLQLRFQDRRACGHVDVGTCPHQVLAANFTLFQQGGGADSVHPILVSTPSFESHRLCGR